MTHSSSACLFVRIRLILSPFPIQVNLLSYSASSRSQDDTRNEVEPEGPEGMMSWSSAFFRFNDGISIVESWVLIFNIMDVGRGDTGCRRDKRQAWRDLEATIQSR
jgi:hypothetical protein